MSLEGQQLGHYRLLRLVGSGGMGEVYLAEDLHIARQVAIKVVRSEVSSYPQKDSIKEAQRLFQREAKAVTLLDHPNILPLYDYGEQNVQGALLIYLVMPFRQEGSLPRWLEKRSSADILSTEDVAHIVGQAAAALQHAHDYQIIHQDVKPANFLIRERTDKPNQPDLLLSDFGIAKLSNATASMSQSSRGTPIYMAPEQWGGNSVPASDQYALAVMAYELLAGRPPFRGGLQQQMYQHLHTQPHPPSSLNPRLSQEVDRVILQALAKEPEERFASIAAFAYALQQALLHTPSNIAVHTPRPPENNEVQATLAISTEEALNGTRRILALPSGQQVVVQVPAGAYNGQLLRVESQSSPSLPGQTQTGGALLINLMVVQPASIQPSEHINYASFASSAPTVSGPSPITSRHAVNQTSTPRQSFPKSTIILLLILALLIGAGGMSFLFLYLSKPNTTTPSQTPSVTTTTTTQGNVTVTTTTPTSASDNPYTHSGTLVLDDPLIDNSRNNSWQTGTNSRQASCTFTSGAYDVTQPAQGFFHSCTATNTDFSNFAFEVQATMISGDYAGMLFCKTSVNTYYLFRIGTDGSYTLFLSADVSFDVAKTLISGSPGSIAVNQTYLMGVVVNGGIISLYLDRQFIKSVSDSTYTHGQIGVLTWDDTHSAETMFRNVKVWKL